METNYWDIEGKNFDMFKEFRDIWDVKEKLLGK